MQGMVDGKGDVQGKYHYTLNESLIGKAQIQLSHRPGYSMYQVESDYLGGDYAVNVRAINANPAENTGIYMASYLQSVTAKLALGVEGVLQRPVPDMEEAGMSLFARYGIPDKSVLTLTLQNLLGLQASYFHKVSDQVELCSEIQAVLAGPQMEAVASIGSKMEYRQASVRAQLDSLGKIAVFLEERLMGRMALLISGEIDHLKGKSKFGVGLSIEN